jgi:asparagine synthase (glutamine-hydrolysing)
VCGWVGYISNPGDDFDHAATIRTMADTIVHRGPDQDDYFVGDGVALGFRRLSIIDLEGGGQPLYNEDNTKVLVFNGEIYNYLDLRAELIAAGHEFRTHTDSEVVLHGYEEWGDGVLDRVRGMFAFVIWDTERRELFGAATSSGSSRSTTTPAAVSSSSARRSSPSCPSQLRQSSQRRPPARLPLLRIHPHAGNDVRRCLQAVCRECFTYRDGQLTLRKYFDYDYRPDNGPTMDEWVDRIAETFTASVKAHKIADVEVGCFLSSGVDSSYATNELHKIQDVRTFSIGYDEEKYSELRYAQDFSALIGVDNISTKISAADYFGAIGAIQYHMDEPLPNPSAVPLYFLAQRAAQDVKVVLSGEGADELFGGYNSYVEPLSYQPYQRVAPAPVRRALGRLAARMPRVPGRRFLMRAAEPIESRFFRHTYNFTPEERGRYLARAIPSELPAAYTKPYFDKVAGHDDITKMQYADLYTWLLHDILLKADKMSMAASLELRVPFLDKEVLKVALAIPTKYRVQKHSTKAALRLAAMRELPAATANKPKLGFPVPLNDWLRQEEFYGQVKAAFEAPIARRFFNQEAILALLDEHRAGAANMKKIWTVYCFLVWYDEYFVKR